MSMENIIGDNFTMRKCNNFKYRVYFSWDIYKKVLHSAMGSRIICSPIYHQTQKESVWQRTLIIAKKKKKMQPGNQRQCQLSDREKLQHPGPILLSKKLFNRYFP